MTRAHRRNSALSDALAAYTEGKTPDSYYASHKDRWTPRDNEVLAQLRGMMVRNNRPVGGLLGEDDIKEIAEYTKEFSQGLASTTAFQSVKSPIRVFEDLMHGGKTAAEQARAHFITEKLKDLYYFYGDTAEQARLLWALEQNTKIEKAFKGGARYDSVLAQLIGEGLVSDGQAAKALADGEHMVVEGLDGVFVFDKNGSLVTFCDSKETITWQKQTVKEHFKQGAAAVVRTKGTLRTVRAGNSVTVYGPSGLPVCEIKDGKGMNMEVVKRTTDSLKGFYASVYEMQNRAMVENGYAPMGHLENYFPHLRKRETGIKGFLDQMSAANLPTAINGLTKDFKPGRPCRT